MAKKLSNASRKDMKPKPKEDQVDEEGADTEVTPQQPTVQLTERQAILQIAETMKQNAAVLNSTISRMDGVLISVGALSQRITTIEDKLAKEGL